MRGWPTSTGKYESLIRGPTPLALSRTLAPSSTSDSPPSRHLRYEPYIKVSCVARPHVVSPAWDDLSVGVTARYKHLLRRKRTGFVPTLYSALGRIDQNGIQDLLFVDRHDVSLQRLTAMGEADCAEGGSMFQPPDASPAWLPARRGNGTQQWVRRWLADASPGYCGKTLKRGDCLAGNQGMFDLLPHEALSWRKAASACMRRCLGCERCRFVSLSLKWQDCSWFHSCSLRRLHTDVPAFKTGARLTRSKV